jgi:hypothetical protein
MTILATSTFICTILPCSSVEQTRRIWQKRPERSERFDSLSKRYRKASWSYAPLSERLAVPFIASLGLLAENISMKALLVSAFVRNRLNANDFSNP